MVATKQRPFIGFIVEGHGEYSSYPTIISKIIQSSSFSPIVNAKGCGNIINHLDEHIDDLSKSYNPLSIIITIDLSDLIKNGTCASCNEAVNLINNNVDNWRKKQTSIEKKETKIIPIIQIKKFETWMISDIESLKLNEIVKEGATIEGNVDNIESPDLWIRDNFINRFDSKLPTEVKKVFGKMDPNKCKENSPSFGKFFKEILNAFPSTTSYTGL